MQRLAWILVAAALTSVLAAGWFAITANAQRDRLSPQMSSGADEPELEEFEQRVRAYLLEHPEVIMEALQVLQERQRAAEAANLKRTIAERSEELLNDPAAPVGGNPAGDVTLVEFFDYNCPYCRRVAPAMVELERADPDLRLVYKEFPILGPGSQFAARAALASRRQGKYVAFHNALMRATEQVAENTAMKIAGQVGLDTERLRRDMEDPAIEAAIARNLQLADALGITGTPSFVIGDQIIPGAVDRGALAALIADVRRSE